MNTFKLTDEHGEKHTYEGSDMREVLALHQRLTGAQTVKCKQVKAK